MVKNINMFYVRSIYVFKWNFQTRYRICERIRCLWASNLVYTLTHLPTMKDFTIVRFLYNLFIGKVTIIKLIYFGGAAAAYKKTVAVNE